ncbi:MAG: VWA domain-containing protein [Pseudomonadota bacterium]
MTLAALQPLFTLASRLRLHGFAVSPDQTMGFVEAVGVLGPRHISDIRHAAIALFAITPERLFEFDAIFQEIFYGTVVSAEAKSSDDSVDAHEDTGQMQSQDIQDDSPPAGTEAVTTEQLHSRQFARRDPDRVLVDFEREAKKRLPQRLSYRWQATHRGKKLDFRRSLKLAARYDGEVVDLSWLKRTKRQRKVLLLIDVSGSMKDRSHDSLRFAHSLVRVAHQCEVFTLGTRLTRVTSVLAVNEIDRALGRVGELVADFDGGTRIGAALQAYLSIPKYAGFARGAAVVVLSDALERGDPAELSDAAMKLSRLSWRFIWLTPLAVDSEYQPETAALQQILPFIDQLGSSHSITAISEYVLQLTKSSRGNYQQAGIA